MNNRVKSVRSRLGITQQELAASAGIARQTIGGIEAGTYAVSLSVALKIAKALGCQVGDLFWLDDEAAHVTARLAGSHESAHAADRVALTHVSGKWIAHPLRGDAAFRTEMVPADGSIADAAGPNDVTVELYDDPRALSLTVAIAGCAPSLPLWTRSAERWHPGLRAFWIHANSSRALASLSRGEVHAAGVHFSDSAAGGNLACVKNALGSRKAVLINLGVWDEGFVVARGNPKGIKTIADAFSSNASMINRELGAGARLLLDTLAASEGIEPNTLPGYENLALGHVDVARSVRGGAADYGVGIASVASAYGLDFVPVRSVQYDIALLEDQLQYDPIQQMIDSLHHRWVTTQLRATGGFDTSRTGDIVAST